jgi:hypothetical protein
MIRVIFIERQVQVHGWSTGTYKFVVYFHKCTFNKPKTVREKWRKRQDFRFIQW